MVKTAWLGHCWDLTGVVFCSGTKIIGSKEMVVKHMELISRGPMELVSRGQMELVFRGPMELVSRGQMELISKGQMELVSRGQMELVSRLDLDIARLITRMIFPCTKYNDCQCQHSNDTAMITYPGSVGMN